jgi:hypothetical protein
MILYHYTTLDGARQILETRKLWASSIRHLNDSSELQYAIDLALKVFPIAAFSDFERRFWLDDLRGGTSYVASFSVHRDQLSQWRGYGGSACGIALGFDAEYIKGTLSPLGYRLEPCIYDPEEQRRLFESSGGSASAQAAAHAIVDLAPRMKQPKFSEEGEWRVISGVPPEPITPSFRVVGSMLVPYRKLPMDPASSIRKVIIGPSPHPQENRFAVELLLLASGIVVPPEASEIAYRTR